MAVWDWHYRVFFDSALRRRIDGQILQLPDSEAEICSETMAFYANFFSFGMLIDQIVESPELVDALITKARAHQAQMLCTPQLLLEYYCKKTSALALSSKQRTELLTLLRLSETGQEIRCHYWNHINHLFGNVFLNITKELDRDCYSEYKRIPKQKRLIGNYKELFNTCYYRLVRNPTLTQWYGTCNIGNFHVDVQEGMAYGEWWDRDLTEDAADRLILFTHDSAVKQEDYYYTIIHETFPGHGHFYNSVRSDFSLDHGANLLIEGWATFCEWHTIPSFYIESVRHNGISLLHNSHHRTSNELAEFLWHEKKKQHIPFEKAVQSIVYATQYIGYSESYYLGALWLEEMLLHKKKYSPKQFLKMLRACNKGDYFRLWL